MKQTTIKKLGVACAAFITTLSVGGLASVTGEWLGPDSAEKYYFKDQLHPAAAEVSYISPIIWLTFGLLLVVAIFGVYEFVHRWHSLKR